MFRTAMAAVLACGMSVASATDWQLVTDSASGDRLIADADSVKIEKYQKGDNTESYRAIAKMSMIRKNDETVVMVIIDALECTTKGSGLMVTKVVDTDETLTHFWSADGPKMYDAQGVWLCSKVMNIVNKKQTAPKKNTQQPAAPKAVKPANKTMI